MQTELRTAGTPKRLQPPAAEWTRHPWRATVCESSRALYATRVEAVAESYFQLGGSWRVRL